MIYCKLVGYIILLLEYKLHGSKDVSILFIVNSGA